MHILHTPPAGREVTARKRLCAPHRQTPGTGGASASGETGEGEAKQASKKHEDRSPTPADRVEGACEIDRYGRHRGSVTDGPGSWSGQVWHGGADRKQAGAVRREGRRTAVGWWVRE
eukprot:scaffold3843_cov117-Isochrysis_galbana.AAC.11